MSDSVTDSDQSSRRDVGSSAKGASEVPGMLLAGILKVILWILIPRSLSGLLCRLGIVVAGLLGWWTTQLGQSDYPSSVFIPLGDWVNVAVDWLTDALAPLFDALSWIILKILVFVRSVLRDWIPWWLIIVLTSVLAWRITGWKIAVFSAIALFIIGALGLWELAMITLAIVITATIIAVAIGIPTGVLAAKSDRFEGFLRPQLDAMQTMPSFVYLIPAVFFFGLGLVPAVVATVIYAVPPCIRLTNLGIRLVPGEVVEAGHVFGSTPWQLLRKIQVPLALPSIMAGVNQTIMMALAMVVICSMIGAGGLGLEVLRGIERLDVGRGFTAGLAIVLAAIIIDRITQGVAKTREPRQVKQ